VVVSAPRHPLQRAGLARRTAPFGAALVLAFIATALVEVEDGRLVGVAAVIALLLFVAVAALPWERLPRTAATLPPLVVYPVALLLRAATGGPDDPVDFEALLLLPVVWFALYGNRLELVLAVTAGLAVELVLLLEDGLDGNEWVRAVFWALVALLIGRRVHRLVLDVTMLSRTDRLTGLTNRAHWDEELLREVQRARRSGRPLAVALVDLDHFKRLNDEEGHAAGDEVLRRCADAWQAQLRASDLLGRYGGEEFSVLLPETGLDQAREVVERLRASTPGRMTCSAGLAVLGGDEPPEAMLERADRALYAAKAAGRDRVRADGRVSPGRPARPR
jgi:diguanylate cyclase (GGDEF)-like protein